jgi:hypothetical protein
MNLEAGTEIFKGMEPYKVHEEATIIPSDPMAFKLLAVGHDGKTIEVTHKNAREWGIEPFEKPTHPWADYSMAEIQRIESTYEIRWEDFTEKHEAFEDALKQFRAEKGAI